MHNHQSLKEIKKEWHGSLSSYLIGLLCSLVLTSASFFLVFTKVISGVPLIFTIVTFALVQAILQLIFFLHLGQEAKPRWETMVCGFMILVLVIIVLGSLWIMYNLNDRTMFDMAEVMSRD